MFKKSLEKIKPYVPGKPIEEVKRELGLKEVYKLASNEIPFEPDYIKQAVVKEIANINRYPEGGCFQLRKELAKKHGVKADQIIFGNGSDEVITMALRAIIEPGDSMIVAFPTFLVYEIQGNACGADIIRVPLKFFRYDLEAMAKKVTPKTKIIFIANPDNPTGTYINHLELEKFLNKIPKDVLVYLDEAYFEFAPKDFPRSLELLNKRGNIIFARTFSKAYGLAGLRLGYGVTTQEIATMLNKIREPFNINRFAQVSAFAALKNKKFLTKVLNHVAKEKEYICSQLNKMGVSFIESAANFILIDFKQDTTELNKCLLKNGVIIRELSSWGLPKFFRVTVGLHKENKKFVESLRKYLKG